ncbi:PQQ-binding-like beta-propeller repeat protein [Nocardioides humilatus]|uniref:PQQ-binding-like beta-propeller repeat protein n=1 Tax=Nocardioides humilatus TaxID=2607660 RepID=A0A5B1LAG9_9ACTN|nr:PQQ-binding-like beta-propeller repeat protein [Nocardioides humilatus]KAA1417741.1 PQQ-binding-like beta-propeller repeat protein [Nocardioides humilatus]
MKRELLAPLAALALLAAGCSGDDKEPGRPEPSYDALTDLHWNVAAVADGALDTCGSIAVMSAPGEGAQVALVSKDRVVAPEVTAPYGSAVVVDRHWRTSGGCVPTADGPVVVIEAQQANANLSEGLTKVVAGFTPEGEQLWSVEEAPTLFASYRGRGSVLLDGLVDDDWVVLDARTGAQVASQDTVQANPVTTLSPTLVDDIDGDLVDLADGSILGRTGDATAQVDDDRMLLQTVEGLELVGLPDLEPIWTADEDLRLTGIWTRAADLSTSTIVAFDSGGAIVGLDLKTGKRTWTSDAARSDVDGLRVQIGSGVIVFGAASNDPTAQVVLDSTTGEELTGADGYVIADQGLLLEIVGDTVRSITVDNLR